MRATRHIRRAFSLIEVVIVVLVLGVAVPPTLNLLDSASAGRVDAINTTRATYLTTAVLETVMADLTSAAPGMGFAALADPAAYLQTPTTGLYDRLQPLTQTYADQGFSYEVRIGELVSSDGSVSAEPTDNIFRLITVSVSFPSASTSRYSMPTSFLVSEI